MRSIQLSNRSRDPMLHIEAPGCIVNIRSGLRTDDGRPVTSVQVIPDGYVGDSWSVAWAGYESGFSARVIKDEG